MNPSARLNPIIRPILGHIIALLAVGIALTVKLLLDPLIEAESPFLLFFAAVMVSAVYGGMRAGITATLSAALAINYLFLSPLYLLIKADFGQNIRLIIFILEGLFISSIISRLTHSQIQLKNNQKALKTSEEKYRLMIESVQDYAIYMLDSNGYVVNGNSGAEGLKGYKSGEIIGKHFSCFYPQEAIEQGTPSYNLETAMANGRFEDEGWRIRQDGSRFWANVVIRTIKDESGTLKGFSKVIRDITERKQAEEALQNAYSNLERRVEERTVELQQQIKERQQIEEALRESDRRFRAIFNQTFQFTGLMQPDGILLEANQTALNFGGLERSDVVGRPVWDTYWWTISPQTQEQLKAAVQQAAKGEFIRYEVDILGAGNTITTIDFSIKPIYDESGQVVLLIPEGRDITQLKQAEKTLRSFFDSASMMMGIVELVDDKDILHITDNATTMKFFGGSSFSPHSQLASQRGIPQDHINQWIEYYRQAEQTQKPVSFEYWHTTPEEQHCLLATVCSIDAKFGQRGRFAYIVEDITERKQAEAQIRQLNAQLEQRVKERTIQLETTNQQLGREIIEREHTLQHLQQAEQSWRQSEQKFRLVAESMPQIVWTALPDGTVDYYNQRWEEFSGMSSQQGEGWGWKPVLHSEDEQPTIDAWMQAVQTGQLYECEHRIRRADGEFRWYLSRGLPLRDEEGHIIKWFGTATDIHEQKEAEEALRLSEERFRIALQHSPIAVFNQDRNLRYTWIYNPKLGYAVEEVIGKTDWDLMHPDDAAKLSEIKHQVITSGVGTRQEIRGSVEAEVSFYDLTVEPLKNKAGEIIGITAAAIDITEQKRTEAELRNRAQQQAAIAHLGQQALASIDIDEFMDLVVRLVAQTLGVEYCKILEKLTDQDLMKLRWGVGWHSGLVGIAAVGTDLESQAGYTLFVQEPVIVADLRKETRFSGPDLLHQHQVISGMSVPVMGQTEHPWVLGVHTTQERTFTQDDVHFLQAVANIVAETIQRQRLLEKLMQQSEELARANRLKDEFLATISHELRTPLNSMLGWAQMLPSGRFDATTTAKALEVIARNTKHLAQLIEDVLNMSDIIRGQLKLDVAPVDLALVIEEAISSIDLAAQAKNIQIESILDFSLGFVRGDANRLRQIVWNLLSNAVKFTPNGGQVQVRLSRINNNAQIQVIDTGFGINPEFLPFVFDRFRQENGSITRTYGGLGLGLAIVRYLVEQHGGTVQASSLGEGKGATFTVEIPLYSY